MTEQLSDRICRSIYEVADSYHQLILVVGPSGSRKSEALREVARASGFPLINANLELSRRLLDLTERQRVLQVSALLRRVVEEAAGEVVLLDNIEILFDLSLQQDPLRLLQQLARTQTVVAAWNGRVHDDHLIYAAPDHAEFRRYPAPGLLVVRAEVTV